jgi:F-type H+-transporting ATPase subunit a
MPEHTSFISYLVAWLFATFPAFADNFRGLKHVVNPSQPVEAQHAAEPLITSLIVVILVSVLGTLAGRRVKNIDEAVIPEDKLTLRTFFEGFVGIFYDMMKEMMGPKRAKRYFPIIGTSACFIFFGNMIGMIPGFNPPTSTWSITAGCAIVIFVMFNYYGIKENGVGYIKHLAGPWLGWFGLPINILVLSIEVISLCIRPVTLSIRLMLNMAVDHLLVAIIFGMISLLVPIPILMLGTLVCIVQVFVFCLLSSIYISLATEHEEHGEHEHAKAHASESASAGEPGDDDPPAEAAAA